MDKDMFSGLGHILKPAIRQAEETDAHLYLQRHDRDQNRKKREQERKEDDYFDTEDRASVSVDALYAFISNMLADDDNADPATQSTPDDKPLHPSAPTQNPAQSGQNAKAAGAYAHAAETSPQSAAPITRPDERKSETGNANNDLLYDLLREIEILKARNIREIYIEKADTFQESLINAILRAKSD